MYDEALLKNMRRWEKLMDSHRTKTRTYLDGQDEPPKMESGRNNKRRELFEAQDAIDRHREDLTVKIEKQLKHTSTSQSLFTVRWRVQ